MWKNIVTWHKVANFYNDNNKYYAQLRRQQSKPEQN